MRLVARPNLRFLHFILKTKESVTKITQKKEGDLSPSVVTYYGDIIGWLTHLFMYTMRGCCPRGRYGSTGWFCLLQDRLQA